MQALLINRGLKELIEFGFALGYSGEAFLGAAGMGDMIATAFSQNSRNFNFGYRFAKGETQEDIVASSAEVIEGVNPILTGSAILPQQSHKVDDSNETLETVMEKLNGMIGLEPVKARAKDYVHYLKFLQLRKEQGFDETQKISLLFFNK